LNCAPRCGVSTRITHWPTGFGGVPRTFPAVLSRIPRTDDVPSGVINLY